MAGIDAMSRLMGSLGLVSGARRRQRGDMDGMDSAEDGASRSSGLPSSLGPLMQRIDEAGEELSRDPTGHVLDNYRKLLAELLDRALKENTHLGHEHSLGLSQRIFQTVTQTDMALAELTDAVLGRQKDLLRVKSIVALLKGLIVDLYR